ncbi:MAG TPA: AAA family ATPase [Pseudonocardiaceae bacterium]|nr:AAA family ATPase [Pseudonocardiaceae bacterium]
MPGRAAPVTVLADLLGGSTGSALLITGDPGTGRTWLADTIAAVPPEPLSRTLSVRAATGFPLWLPRELLRLVAELVGTGAPDYRPGALRELLRTEPRQRGALVIDDVHLLDADGAAALTELLAISPSLRPQLALTAASGWTELLPGELVTALAALPRHELTAFTDDELREFGAELLGVPLAEPTVHALRAATNGNPAALHGVLTDALRRGGVVVLDGTARLVPGLRLALPDWHQLIGRADERCGTRVAIPVLAEALERRMPPWRRAEVEADRLEPDASGGPVGPAMPPGRPVSPAEREDTGAWAAGLLPFVGVPAPAELVVPAVRYWVRTGQWGRVRGLPRESITSSVVLDRLRADLLTGGLTTALSDVELLGGADLSWCAAELLLFAGLPDQAAAELAEDQLAELARRPGLAADNAAYSDWAEGRWDELLALAARERLTGAAAHQLASAEESAAFAAEVWLNRGRPEFARQWLVSAKPVGEAVLRPLAEWASAGLDLLYERFDAAIDRLGVALDWMTEHRFVRHRDLLVARLATALALAGRLDEAAEACAQLTEPDLCLATELAIAEAGGPAPEIIAPDSANPLLLARIELAAGKRAQDPALIASAGQRFAALGATVWQLRAEGAARAISEAQPWGVPTASADELIMDLVADGLSNAQIAAFVQRNEMYVKRQVSRLLRATGSQNRAQLTARARQPVGLLAEPIPADPAAAIAESEQPVAVLLGAPGSGRSTVLARVQKLLADKGITAVLVRGGRASDLAVALRVGLGLSRAGAGGLPELAAAFRAAPPALLVDDADLLDETGRALIRLLARETRLVLVGAGSGAGLDAALADRAGPCVVPKPLVDSDIATDRSPAALEDLLARTAGNPGAVTWLLSGRATPPSRVYAELEQNLAAQVLAALPGDRLAAIEAALSRVDLDVSGADLRGTATQLLRTGFAEETEDGGLRFPVPVLRESLAARLPVTARTALHRALAEDALRAGTLVDQRALAEHLVGAGAGFGQGELVAAAEQVLDSDPALALRWSSALLAADSTDPRTHVVAARACYALARYRQAIDLARTALAALPQDNQRDTLVARTVLINSLVRTGQHDAALDVTADPEAAGAVTNGLQQARIALLGERFDDALAALAQLRPAAPNHQAALLAGVRILAAIGADGVAWRDAERAGDSKTPLPDDRLEQARHALAWGDLFTAERGIIAGAHPSPAARRPPPPSLGRLSAAVLGLRVGDWAGVRAIADEHAAADEEVTHVDGIIAALAAETWLRQDQPARAAQLLANVRAEQLFGHVIGWAAAGVDLAEDRAGQAVAALSELDQRCRRLGYLTGRELVLSRKVDAELADGDRAGAERTADELGELVARINTRQARLYWLVARLAIRPTERVAQTAAQLADELGDRFLGARVQLSNPDTLRTAYGTFRELGALRWQKLAADLLRDHGITVRPPTVLADADRKLIEMIAAGATNGDVAAALGVTEKAVEGRLTRLYKRTGLRSRADLVREYGVRRDAG